jgi:hypothetical protein
MLDTKEKLIATMKRSNEGLIPVDFSPVDEQYRLLADIFHVNISRKFFNLIFSSIANQSTIIRLGKRIQSTFTIMERF